MRHIASTRRVHASRINFSDELSDVLAYRVTDSCVDVATRFVAVATVSSSYTKSAGFAEHVVKPYIPRICRNFLDFLAFEREPDQLWTPPRSRVAEKRKRSVVVAATHTNTIQVSVNCDAWSDDDVEFRRIDFIAVRRFPEPEFRPLERGFAQYAQKSQLPATTDDRCVDRLSHRPGAIENSAGVDFVAHRDITRDVLR